MECEAGRFASQTEHACVECAEGFEAPLDSMQACVECRPGSVANSTATWKVIASDMPLGLLVPDKAEGRATFVEAISNGRPGQPAGRELEIAELLRHVRDSGAGGNLVWLTADVHYTAAHHYSPDRAAFQKFEPF